jgi:hypothetical protein
LNALQLIYGIKLKNASQKVHFAHFRPILKISISAQSWQQAAFFSRTVMPLSDIFGLHGTFILQIIFAKSCCFDKVHLDSIYVKNSSNGEKHTYVNSKAKKYLQSFSFPLKITASFEQFFALFELSRKVTIASELSSKGFDL